MTTPSQAQILALRSLVAGIDKACGMKSSDFDAEIAGKAISYNKISSAGAVFTQTIGKDWRVDFFRKKVQFDYGDLKIETIADALMEIYYDKALNRTLDGYIASQYRLSIEDIQQSDQIFVVKGEKGAILRTLRQDLAGLWLLIRPTTQLKEGEADSFSVARLNIPPTSVDTSHGFEFNLGQEGQSVGDGRGFDYSGSSTMLDHLNSLFFYGRDRSHDAPFFMIWRSFNTDQAAELKSAECLWSGLNRENSHFMSHGYALRIIGSDSWDDSEFPTKNKTWREATVGQKNWKELQELVDDALAELYETNASEAAALRTGTIKAVENLITKSAEELVFRFA